MCALIPRSVLVKPNKREKRASLLWTYMEELLFLPPSCENSGM